MLYVGLYLLVTVNLILIGLYMHARTRDDKNRVKIYQPAATLRISSSGHRSWSSMSR